MDLHRNAVWIVLLLLVVAPAAHAENRFVGFYKTLFQQLFGFTGLASGGIQSPCPDADRDSYQRLLVSGCTFTTTGDPDCNDDNPNVNPGANELCNGIDDDCDGQVDEGCLSCPSSNRDNDRDGYPQSRSNQPGCNSNPDDCNDNNLNIYPGATEVCNNVDDDCDGQVDEGNVCGSPSPPSWPPCTDADSDEYTGLTTSQRLTCQNAHPERDCNDNNRNIHPGATEICNNGVDENCDSRDGTDRDGDGFTADCGGRDCNDANPSINPIAREIAGNGIDENCDGQDGQRVIPRTNVDQDGDGVLMSAGDCNDNNPNVKPGALEICTNNIDDDCDGKTDKGVSLDGGAVIVEGDLDCGKCRDGKCDQLEDRTCPEDCASASLPEEPQPTAPVAESVISDEEASAIIEKLQAAKNNLEKISASLEEYAKQTRDLRASDTKVLIDGLLATVSELKGEIENGNRNLDDITQKTTDINELFKQISSLLSQVA